jgi:cell division protein FtsA
MFNLVNEELKNSGYMDYIAAGGVIMTGGSAKLQGIIEAAEQVIGLPARIGIPQGVRGVDDVINDLTFASVLGILHFQGLNEWSRNKRSMQKPSLFGKLKRMFEEVM